MAQHKKNDTKKKAKLKTKTSTRRNVKVYHYMNLHKLTVTYIWFKK